MYTELSRTELDARLRTVIASVLGASVEEIEDNERFVEAYGGDSMSSIEVLARVESEFDVEIAEVSLPRLTTLAATREVLLEALANAEH